MISRSVNKWYSYSITIRGAEGYFAGTAVILYKRTRIRAYQDIVYVGGSHDIVYSRLSAKAKMIASSLPCPEDILKAKAHGNNNADQLRLPLF